MQDLQWRAVPKLCHQIRWVGPNRLSPMWRNVDIQNGSWLSTWRKRKNVWCLHSKCPEKQRDIHSTHQSAWGWGWSRLIIANLLHPSRGRGSIRPWSNRRSSWVRRRKGLTEAVGKCVWKHIFILKGHPGREVRSGKVISTRSRRGKEGSRGKGKETGWDRGG